MNYGFVAISKEKYSIDNVSSDDGWNNFPVPIRAYARFDSSDSTLYFFRDEGDKYINGQTEGTVTYYTGIETTDYHAGSTDEDYVYPPWYSNRSNIQYVVFEDEVEPISTFAWFTMSNLQHISDIDKLNTSNVTNMGTMFNGCSMLSGIDLSNFDTSNVTNMANMFTGCTSLTSLDLSNFDTSNVENMASMFSLCVYLEVIFVSNLWNTDAVVNGFGMFTGCLNIVGGNGTGYNSSHMDKEYARIDTASTPGYLTYKSQ